VLLLERGKKKLLFLLLPPSTTAASPPTNKNLLEERNSFIHRSVVIYPITNGEIGITVAQFVVDSVKDCNDFSFVESLKGASPSSIENTACICFLKRNDDRDGYVILNIYCFG